MYELCARHDIPHRRLGKLIVARTADEIPAVERLFRQGRDNGAELELIGALECRRREPNVTAVAALWSPNTGIVSAHGLMDHYLQVARSGEVTLQARTEVVGLEKEPAGYRQHWCKGSYFAVAPAKATLVSSLIYPVPGHVSLGTHAVVGLEGRLRFAPDAEYLPGRVPDYGVGEAKRAGFGESVRRLVPAIADDDLAPDIAGIRAKLQGPGQGFLRLRDRRGERAASPAS